MKNIILIVVMSLCMAACASIKSRFPEYAQQVKGKESLNVVIDSILISDIKGEDLGFNKEKNSLALEKIKTALDEALTERGFIPDYVQDLDGLFYEKETDRKYFISEGWESTEVEYVGVLDEQSPWLNSQLRSFLKALVKEGKNTHYGKPDKLGTSELLQDNEVSEEALEPDKLFDDWQESPGVLRDLGADLVMYVQIDGTIQSLGKSLGEGLLTGAASGLLTGGLIIARVPGSVMKIQVLVLDTQHNKVVWQTSGSFEGARSVKHCLKVLLKNYPTVKGEFLIGEEEANRRKLRGY